MNKNFDIITNKEKFKNWLIRQYFNQEKNTNDPWFKKTVNATNVLEHISDSQNCFPLTPAQITDMWICINSFKKRVKKTTRDINGYCERIDQQEKVKTEHTLENVGKQLGGITATMINRLSKSAMDKFKILTFETHFSNMTDEDLLLFNKGIEKFRNQALDKYIILLRDSQGDLNTFFNALIKEQIMTKKEIELLQPIEYDVLLQLYALTDKEIKKFLLIDIEMDNNMIKSFQSMISRQAFPTKKRGRPRKIK
jgi:hypothetical protein